MTYTGNQLISMTFAALLLTALGCQAAPRRATLPTTKAKWGTTRIALANNLGWPYRLSGVVIAIDGVVLHRRTAGTARPEQTGLLHIGDLELRPGDHTIEAQLTASYRATPLAAADCNVQLRAAKGFRVDYKPARLDLDLHLTDVTKRFSERVELAVTMRGAKEVAHQTVPHPRHELAVPDTTEAMLAGARARVVMARERRDIVQLACYDQKLAQLRSFSTLLDRRRTNLASNPDMLPNQIRHERRVMGAIEGRMAELWTEMNQCSSNDGYQVETLRTVAGMDNACNEAEPLELFDDETSSQALFAFGHR